MSDEKPKKQKKRSAAKENGGGKEHKRPWQEAYATPEEIKAMLSERVLLRYNEVRGRTEVHWLSQGLTIGEDEQAYTLYKQGFQYWFEKAEIQRLQRHNERFESSCTERELVFWYFRPPETEGEGEFMPVGLARETDTHTPDTPVF